jgi:hypothetical protein
MGFRTRLADFASRCIEVLKQSAGTEFLKAYNSFEAIQDRVRGQMVVRARKYRGPCFANFCAPREISMRGVAGSGWLLRGVIGQWIGGVMGKADKDLR